MCEYECNVRLMLIFLFLCPSSSFSRRFKVPESAKIDTVLGNLTVFEYLENKVRIKLSSSLHPLSVLELTH